MHRIRVLLLSTDLQKGGLPLRLVRLARRFGDVNVEPVVGCLTSRGPLSDVLGADGIETFACDAAGRFDLRCFSKLAAHIRRLNPDVIHASLFHANLAARLVGRQDRPRPILTSSVTIEIERRLHLAFESMTSGLSDLHAANSEAVAAHVREDLGFSSEKVVVVPNAVDFDAIDRTPPIDRASLGLKPDVPLVVWVGRMDPVKNLRTWIDVFERVLRERPVQGLLIGDGPERRHLEKLVEERRLSQYIRFAGWMDDVIGVLKSADAMLFPSLTEGSPNALLEAICCGCPVVTSDAAACVELIREAGRGMSCHAYDTKRMTEFLLEILSASSSQKSGSRSFASPMRTHRDMSSILAKWRDAYDRLIAWR